MTPTTEQHEPSPPRHPGSQPKPPQCPVCRKAPCVIVAIQISLGPLQASLFTCWDCGAILSVVPTDDLG